LHLYASPTARHKEKEEADPATNAVQDKDFVVGADPTNTNIVTVAVPKHAEDGINGNFRKTCVC